MINVGHPGRKDEYLVIDISSLNTPTLLQDELNRLSIEEGWSLVQVLEASSRAVLRRVRVISAP